MAACHCYSWWSKRSDTLWATYIRLWPLPHSLSSCVCIVVAEISLYPLKICTHALTVLHVITHHVSNHDISNWSFGTAQWHNRLPMIDNIKYYLLCDSRTNRLKFGPEFLGRVRLVTAVASLVGVGIYNSYLKHVSLQKMFFWSTIVGSSLGLTQVRDPWSVELSHVIMSCLGFWMWKK